MHTQFCLKNSEESASANQKLSYITIVLEYRIETKYSRVSLLD